MGAKEDCRGKIRTKWIFVKYGTTFHVKFKLHKWQILCWTGQLMWPKWKTGQEFEERFVGLSLQFPFCTRSDQYFTVHFRNHKDSVGVFQVNEQAATTAGCSCARLFLHQWSMGGAMQQEKYLKGAVLVLGGQVGECAGPWCLQLKHWASGLFLYGWSMRCLNLIALKPLCNSWQFCLNSWKIAIGNSKPYDSEAVKAN